MEISYCLFEINQHVSAVKADYLEEVVALPELILLPNAPSGIVGVIALRGEVLPVVDLRVSDPDQSQHYRLTDSVIILKQSDLRIGLVANAVQDLRELSTQGMMTELPEHQDWMNPDIKRFFAGMILNQADILILHEPQSWFNPGELQQVIAVTRFLVDDFYEPRLGQSSGALSEAAVTEAFAPNATAQEQLIFRQRADNLKRVLNDDQATIDTKTLIVIALDNQLLGIDANCVREFITVSQATPVPCCPRHIIGNTNLRGEVLTVIDISEPLGFSSQKILARNPKAVVIELDHTLTAIVVEEIRDALFEVDSRNIQVDYQFPTRHSYVRGAVPYGEQMMHILDLPKLLHSNELVVNEIF